MTYNEKLYNNSIYLSIQIYTNKQTMLFLLFFISSGLPLSQWMESLQLCFLAL